MRPDYPGCAPSA